MTIHFFHLFFIFIDYFHLVLNLNFMSKEKTVKKEAKKAPTKTLKEKRAEKKAKKATK